MAIKIPEPQRIQAHDSTWVALDVYGEVSKLETFPRYATSWRGDEVIVTLSCDRYRCAPWDGETVGRLTDWRVYAQDARVLKRDDYGAIAPYGYGVEVTDTARNRLGDACKPLALAWLESDDASEALRAVLVAAIVRELRDDLRGGILDRTRRLIVRHGDEIGPESVDRLTAACDAADAYLRAVANV